MTITLPDEVVRKAQQRATAAGFPTVERFAEALIEEEVDDDLGEEITEEDFRRGDEDMAAGRGRPMEEVIRELARTHNISLDGTD